MSVVLGAASFVAFVLLGAVVAHGVFGLTGYAPSARRHTRRPPADEGALSDFQVRCEAELTRRVEAADHAIEERRVVTMGFEGEPAIVGRVEGITFWIYDGYGADMEAPDGSGGHYEPEDFDGDAELIEAFVSEVVERLV